MPNLSFLITTDIMICGTTNVVEERTQFVACTINTFFTLTDVDTPDEKEKLQELWVIYEDSQQDKSDAS